MKALVTGAPGWLGTRLTEILIENGREVRCLVFPSAGDEVLKELGAKIFKGDLTKPETLNGACENIDTVFHCAGMIHPKHVKEFYDINFQGTKNVLNEALKASVNKFIYVSSNSVSGTNTSRDKMMQESDPPHPYRHYGLSKLKAEKALNQAFAEGKIKGTIIRPCWFYGVRQPERQTRFFKMIKKGDPILFGNGKNLRSMSYIDNVIDALLLSEEKDIANGNTYWIADKNPYSSLEIYNAIAVLLGVKDFHPKYVPGIISTMCEMADIVIQALGGYVKEIHVAGEMDKDIACSIKKAQEELGYAPKVDLEEGMRRSIEWCRANGVEI